MLWRPFLEQLIQLIICLVSFEAGRRPYPLPKIPLNAFSTPKLRPPDARAPWAGLISCLAKPIRLGKRFPPRGITFRIWVLDILRSKTQMRKVIPRGGNLFPSLIGLARGFHLAGSPFAFGFWISWDPFPFSPRGSSSLCLFVSSSETTHPCSADCHASTSKSHFWLLKRLLQLLLFSRAQVSESARDIFLLQYKKELGLISKDTSWGIIRNISRKDQIPPREPKLQLEASKREIGFYPQE